MSFVSPKKAQPSLKYLRPRDMRRLKNLWFAARVIVEGAYAGRHKSPFKGSSQEFTDYREYAPGDEIRMIDWKAFARTDRYFIKVFEKETDMTCYLLVDGSASMGFGGKAYDRFLPDEDYSKFEYGCYLAAALSYLIVKQGDKVGLTLFDDEVRSHLRPGGSLPHLYRLLHLLERYTTGRKTSISHVLRNTFPLFRQKGLVLVISDLLDDPEEIFDALNLYRYGGHEVILFHLLHRYELELPPLASVNFIDSETDERVTSVPGDIRESYQELIGEFTDQISSYANARGIDYQLMSTDTPFHEALEKYLEKRA